MRTPLVFHNLLHNRLRMLLSVAGVCLSTVLIFLQLGFLGAVESTATLIYDRLEFDVVLRSPDYLHLCDARSIPLERLQQAASISAVANVTPFHVMMNNWQNPRTGHGNAIVVMASQRSQIPLDVPELRRQGGRLDTPADILVDRTTHADYGPADGRRFGDDDIGVVTEVGDAACRIVGHFELGTGLAAKGAIYTSDVGFSRIAHYDATRQASLGLVELAPGVSPQDAVARIQAALGDRSIDVLDRQEVIRRELQRWVSDTPIGRIFQMGVVLAFLVGATIVYMVLSTDVTNRIAEYATLKAMGYSQAYLSRLVMQQALLLAIAGYLPAWAAAEVIYRLTSRLADIPVAMTASRLGVVLLLAVMMCLVSGLLALGKLRRANPADLF